MTHLVNAQAYLKSSLDKTYMIRIKRKWFKLSIYLMKSQFLLKLILLLAGPSQLHSLLLKLEKKLGVFKRQYFRYKAFNIEHKLHCKHIPQRPLDIFSADVKCMYVSDLTT